MWSQSFLLLSSSSMEVDSVQVNGFEEQAFSPDCSDVFGDPNIFPKVGEQYQAEIAPLLSESDYYWFKKKPHDAERTCTFNESQVGLPIPIIWIKDEVEDNKHGQLKHACKSIGVTKKSEFSKLECILNSPGHDDKLNPEPEAIDNTLVNGTKLGVSGNSNVQQETKIGVHENKCKGHCLVPGSSTDTWNEIEEASFTLGLYIFGKNLVQVKRFIGNKKMGDIMAFYYGKFYKSERYQRWSELRKMKSRKCIYGQKIFTGPRQQELLSRLLPNVPEECRSKLLEVSKIFVEGKMLLEDYVLTLKASVGLNALVEAVGVGTGKDLTGLTADSVKSTQALPVRPEKQVGKDCSRLTPAEIINILTGNFRLSKARSSDLFWEAVWPRLLARGWHSEQLGSDDNYAVAYKHPLIFLVPGVNKFSRELEKGDDYFDSICDVLGKVASDPELIELETNADNDCTTKEGNGCTRETNLDQENSPDPQRHCYLMPRTPNCSTEVNKFNVVDTTLGRTEITEKDSTSEDDSNNEDASEDQTKEPDFVDAMCLDKGKTDATDASKFIIAKGVPSGINGIENNPTEEEVPMRSISSTNPSADSKDQKTDWLSNTQGRDAMECQSIKRGVPDSNNVEVPPVTKKRRRLSACSREERNVNSAKIFMVPGVKQDLASFCADNSKPIENVAANIFVAPRVNQENASYCLLNSKFSENVLSQETPPEVKKNSVGLLPQENKTLADSLSIPSSIIGREAVPATSSSCTKDQPEKPQPRTIMIDLNIPVPPEVEEADEPFVTEVAERQQDNTGKESDDTSVENISKPVDHPEHQPEMNTRRKSKRTTLPTLKVLEAMAYGYLEPKDKRKRRD